MIPSVSANELAQELATGVPLKLLDVRETFELEISRLDNVVHIPMGELPSRLNELDAKENWVIVCRSGARSAHVTETLLANGFSTVRNLDGGMNGWARLVDPNLATY
ncbi:MAG: rhodanese-like domain-containing protein [Fimbriimonadaceae bacterium]